MAQFREPLDARPARRPSHARLLHSAHAWIYCLAVSASVHAAGLVGLGFIRTSPSAANEVELRDDVVLHLDLRTTSMFAKAADEPGSDAEGAPFSDGDTIPEQTSTDAEAVQADEPPAPGLVIPPEEFAATTERETSAIPLEPTDLPESYPFSADAQIAEEPVAAPSEDPIPAIASNTPNPARVSEAPNASASNTKAGSETIAASGAAAIPAAGAGAGTGGTDASGKSAPSTASSTGLGAPRDIDARSLHARRSARPVYPEECRRRGEQGSVTCRLKIDREGVVVDVQVTQSSGFQALDEAAVRTLKRWLFERLDRLTDRECVFAVQRLSFELTSARR
jgi:periplasmic protein TonB